MNAAVIAETIRRHVTNVGFIVALIFIALIGILAATFNVPGSLWPSLTGLVALITGSALIGPEFSASTLQLIVSKPIRRSVYLVSRVAGVFVCVAIAALAGFCSEIAARLLLTGGAIPWLRIGFALAMVLTTSLMTISLLTFLGSVTRSYFNIAIYLGVEIAFSAAQALLGALRVRGAAGALLRQYPQIERSLMIVDDTLYPDAPPFISGAWFARVVFTALIAIALACLAFERREVPYGAD